jgi:hypothetical protein
MRISNDKPHRKAQQGVLIRVHPRIALTTGLAARLTQQRAMQKRTTAMYSGLQKIHFSRILEQLF